MKKTYGIIYKATNKKNKKVYIGQTTRSLSVRIIEHGGKGKEKASPWI